MICQVELKRTSHVAGYDIERVGSGDTSLPEVVINTCGDASLAGVFASTSAE